VKPGAANTRVTMKGMRLALNVLMSSMNSANKAAARAEQPCPPETCPNCGKDTPAASNRSDGVVSFRCDVCGHQWTSTPAPSAQGQPAAARESDSELPPVAAIDAPGG
jgi:transposase-like protein